MEKIEEEMYFRRTHKSLQNNEITKIEWVNSKGEHHNPDGPAVIEYDPDTGNVVQLEWRSFGQPHRFDEEGPAIIVFDHKNGTERHEYWLHGKLFRNSGPTIEVLDSATGAIIEKFEPNDFQPH